MTAVPARLTDEHRKMLGRFVARVVEFLEVEIDYSGGESYEIHPRCLLGMAVQVTLRLAASDGNVYKLDTSFDMEHCTSNEHRMELFIRTTLTEALRRFRKRPLPKPEVEAP
jgi:hypothetical protein